jgi:hypothetical protein
VPIEIIVLGQQRVVCKAFRRLKSLQVVLQVQWGHALGTFDPSSERASCLSSGIFCCSQPAPVRYLQVGYAI